MMKFVKQLLRLMIPCAVVAYLGLVVLALRSGSIIFQPHPSSYRPAELARSGNHDVRPLTFASGKANISAVYLPNGSAPYTLLFSHGNAEDIGDDLPMLEAFRSAGFAVFAYDYRGYGASDGISSEQSLYQDSDSAYEYVTGTLPIARSESLLSDARWAVRQQSISRQSTPLPVLFSRRRSSPHFGC